MGAGPVRYTMVSSTSGLYSLDPNSTVRQIEMLPDIAKFFLGAKLPPLETNGLMGTNSHLHLWALQEQVPASSQYPHGTLKRDLPTGGWALLYARDWADSMAHNRSSATTQCGL